MYPLETYRQSSNSRIPKLTDMYAMIAAQLGANVPFARHAGIEITEVAKGTAAAKVAPAPERLNHVQSIHAGVLYTLGETCSGAAMAGAIAPVLMQARPLAATAEIKYLSIAKGDVFATAKTSKPAEDILSALQDDGKAAFNVEVEMKDDADTVIANMTVGWHVRMN